MNEREAIKNDQHETNDAPSGARTRLWSILLLLTFMACADSGGGCEGGGLAGCAGAAGCADSCGVGCVDEPYDPAGAVIAQGAQVRVTAQGMAFLEEALEPLAAGILDTGDDLSICVPRGNVAPLVSYCYSAPMGDCVETADCPDGALCELGTCYYSSCGIDGDEVVTGCQVDIGISEVDLAPTEVVEGPDRLDISLYVDLDEYIPIGSCPALHVQGTAIPITASVVFYVDDEAEGDLAVPGTSENVWIDIVDVGFDLSGVALSVPDELGVFGDPEICGDPADALALIEDLLDSSIEPMIREAVDGFVCTPCDAEGACVDGASCDIESNLCRFDATDACVPTWLGAEGAIDVAGLLGGFGGEAEPMSFLFYAGNYADAEAQGLSLGLRTGLYAAHDACVPRVDPPATDAVTRSGELTSGIDEKGEAFMMGIAIDRSVLDLGLWSMHQSGALCLAVDSSTSLSGSAPPLTTSLVGLLFGIRDSLDALTRVAGAADIRDAGLLFSVRPQQAPTVSLGRAEIEGESTVVEPTLLLSMNEVFIDLYAWVEARYVRIFTLDVDIAFPLALVPSEDGRAIRLLRGDLDDIFTRAEVRNASLLSDEEIEAIPAALPSLVGILEPSLPPELTDPIALPDLAGLNLTLGESGITTLENHTMLAILANLEVATPTPAFGMVDAPPVEATLVEVRLPSSAAIADALEAREAGDPVRLDALRSQVVIEVDTLSEDTGPSGPREVSYRLNGGMWRQFAPLDGDGRLVIDDPTLLLEGEHAVEVQTRRADGSDYSRVSEALTFTIDLSLPEVAINTTEDDRVRVTATDGLWDDESLRVRYRWGQQAWHDSEQPPSGEGVVVARSADHEAELTVVVSDPSGHERLVTRTFAIHGRTTNTDTGDDGCGGCAVGARGRSIDASWLLLLGLFAGRRRAVRTRRRFSAASLVALFFAMFLSACADGRREPTTLDEDLGEDVSDDTGDMGVDTDDDPDAGFDASADADVVATCDEHADCAELSCSGGDRGVCVDDACICAAPCDDACGGGEFCCATSNSCEPGPGDCGEFACGPRETAVVVTEGGADEDTCSVTEPTCGCEAVGADVGAFLSASATPDGHIVAAAYDWRFGDLHVGVLDPEEGADATFTWEAIDGLPGDSGDPDVGRYADLVVAADGTVHIAYYDRTARAPRYARGVFGDGGYTFTTMAIESDLPGGTFASIALSPEGVPAVAYFAESVAVDESTRHSQLRVAWADAAEPTSWTVETIVSVPRPAETPDYAALPEGNGLFAQLGFASTGEALLAWYDHGRGNVMSATAPAGTFAGATPSIIDGERFEGEESIDTGDVGWYLAMTIGDDDDVHLTYVDATRDRLIYRALSADEPEVVDDGVRGEAAESERVLVGDDSHLVLLADGTPQVVFGNTTTHQVMIAHRPEIGWTQAAAAVEPGEAGAVGFYNQQVVQSDGTTYVFTYQHAADRENRGLIVTLVE